MNTKKKGGKNKKISCILKRNRFSMSYILNNLLTAFTLKIALKSMMSIQQRQFYSQIPVNLSQTSLI